MKSLHFSLVRKLRDLIHFDQWPIHGQLIVHAFSTKYGGKTGGLGNIGKHWETLAPVAYPRFKLSAKLVPSRAAEGLTGFKEELSQLRADLEREQTSRKVPLCFMVQVESSKI